MKIKEESDGGKREEFLCVEGLLVGHKLGEPVGRTWVHIFGAFAHPEKVLLLLLLQGELIFQELVSEKKGRLKKWV